MKVGLIGSEQNVAMHLEYWSTVPTMDVEPVVIESQEDISLFHLVNDIDLVDLCVSEELIEGVLERINSQVAILVTEVHSNIDKYKDIVEENTLFRFSTSMMCTPELTSLQEQIKHKQLGRLGVHYVSLKSQPFLPVYRSFSHKEFSLLQWIVATFGAFKTLYAKNINNRYITTQIRLMDDSFIQLELARGFGKGELTIELTGVAGMLSYSEEDTTPIQLTMNNGEEQAFRPLGKPILHRQLQDAYHCFVQGEQGFSNVEEINKTIQVIDAINQSIEQDEPMTNNGGCQ
ncbi:hypothetical protein [Gracilibacillus suaedae]|uniref:hypothetical protein n=1 Tax=Gracilibacillus suaedae TaxID=2820273 RepID=UPI001ABE5D48|nr:hypothetical protein [Gracilibacillus suaedae]